MNRFKSVAVNRWLTGFLCLSLLISILSSSTRLILRRAAAQGDTTLQGGAKLATNLPDLSRIRYKTIAHPKAPDLIGTANPCFDCNKSSPLDDAFSLARLDPENRTGASGVDLLSENAHWSQSLINLKGRAGLNLSLSLAYNSLVWTKAGSQIAFDADRGQPSPGFRLGFPTILPRYRNTETGKFSYLLITPEGKRVELRQVGDRNVYESVDNSLLQMVDNGASGALMLRPDGTRLTLEWIGNRLQSTKFEDRNGNYIKSDYDDRGHLKSVTDTVGRTFLFIRDQGGNLTSIKQKSSGPENRVLATFGYSNLLVQTNFSGAKVMGPTNGSTITVLTQVGIPDGSRYQFDYTSWGQVSRITKSAPDGHALTYVSYNLPKDASTASVEVPRVTELRNWIEGENNDGEMITRYDVEPSGRWGQVTLPDGSVHKEFFATAGWERGLATSIEDWAGNILQKRTTIDFTQDDTSLSYPLNPRQQKILTEDSQGHRLEMRIEYTSYGLPTDMTTLDGSAPVTRTHLEYDFDTEYVKRHILGLVRERTVYGPGGNLISKTSYDYDLPESVVDQGQSLQHDNINYGSNYLIGRGLRSAINFWNAKSGKSKLTYLGYNTNGSLAFRRDDSGQQINFDYSDDFADQKERRSMAFVTSSTGSGGKRSSIQYDYETGAPVRTDSWQDVAQTFAYDSARRLIATSNSKTGATMRRIYDENGTLVATFKKMGDKFKELGTYTVLDGVGQVRARAIDPISKAGGYRGIYINRDVRGRIINQTKQIKMSSSWSVAEPIALNSSGSLGAETKSIISSIVVGFNEFVNAIEPTTYAQTPCPPGYYCGNNTQDLEWGTMDYNGMPDSVEVDGVNYSVSVSYQPESVTVSMIHDGGVETDWGAQFAIAGLLEAMMGAFGEVGGVFASESGGEISGEVADTSGNVVADQNTLNHIFGNPEHGFDAFLSQFGGSWQEAFQAIHSVVQSLGLPDGYFEEIVNVNGTNVWVQCRVVNGVVDINTASAVIH